MGNLGKYQDIVTAAKRVGGVENLIKIIENGAVAKAAPKIFAKGAGVGALGALGATLGIRRYSEWRAEREASANLAKAQLRAGVEHAAGSDAGEAGGPQAGPDAEGDDER